MFLIDPNTSLLENLVAIQLHKKYKDNLYYYLNGVEVDFVVPDEKFAIQVAYSLADFDTRKREITALGKIAKQMEIDKMLIITKDEEETIIDDEIKIEVIPIWKWLLS